ncbi:efflux transporter outer membrane subunit [Acanthopleuribacter pedis]|uniref:Efflux transporter outer membrane subunit n=1 Tax=Acanthopleuribacter pedis TaxID=442870 RepID=A0A8J7QCW8_9BACT|nr:efflux transporter outer membrane subunit [Acanthopleuribacter pedis]MBO1323431.1 efflux transporter outer membrane subunit [Acanthopleuribacter pedis]
MRPYPILKRAAVAAALFGSFHCAPVRPLQDAEPPEATAQTFLAEKDNRFADASVVTGWWGRFNDPQLTALVERALAHNLDVVQAVARLDRNTALLKARGYDRYPTVTSQAGYSRERASEELVGPVAAQDGNRFNLAANIAWELDILGRIKQRIAVAETEAAWSEADLDAVRISVAAEVGRAYMDLRGAQYRLDVAERNLANQKESVELTQALSEGGRGTDLDVARAETLLRTTQASIPPIQADLARAVHRLAVLTAQPSAQLRADLGKPRALPSLPEQVGLGDVAGLLQRRPDLRQAQQRVLQATAQYNLEATDLFPRVSVIGSLGFLSGSFSNLFTSEAFNYAIGPVVDWSFLDRHRQKAELSAADARVREQVAAYQQQVLAALEELDNALAAFSREEERRRQLVLAGQSAAKTVELARVRFEAGIDSYLDVLDAERTLLETESSLAVSEIAAANQLIAVYYALGGAVTP